MRDRVTVKGGHTVKTFVFSFMMGEVKEKEGIIAGVSGRGGDQSPVGVTTLRGREDEEDSADVGKCVGEVAGS